MGHMQSNSTVPPSNPVTYPVKEERAMKLTAVAILIVAVGVTVAVLHNANRADATEQVMHGYICRQEVGFYDDALCTTGLSGTHLYNKVIIPPSAEKLKIEAIKKFELEGTVASIKVLISCSNEKDTGTAWNPEPVKTKPGEGESTLNFESCSVAEPKACTISGGKIAIKVHGVMEDREKLGPGVKITPASGETFAKIPVGEACPVGETLVVNGSTYGITNNPSSSLEFTNGSSSLTMGSKAASLRGKTTFSDATEGNWVVQAP